MIQLLLTLVGLFFPTNSENKVNSIQDTITIQAVNLANPGEGLDTGGDTIQVPPKK